MMGTCFRRFVKQADTSDKEITQYFWLTGFFLHFFHLKQVFRKKMGQLSNEPDQEDETGYEVVASSIDLDPIRYLIRRIELHQFEASHFS